MFYEVLEPNFHTLLQDLKKVKTIDEIIDCHHLFLDKCLKECLLTHQKSFETIQHINMHSHLFTKIIKGFVSNYMSEV